MNSPTMMLIDGNYILHRVMKLENFVALRTQDGEPTGGVYGVLTMLRTYLAKYSAVSDCVVVWDGSHSPRRTAILPEYKAHRLKTDPSEAQSDEAYMRMWYSQRKILEEVLPDFGVRSVRLLNREGDDTLWFIVLQRPKPMKVIISDDQDILQMVSPDCIVYRPIADEEVSQDNFTKVTGVPLALFLLMKAITGDVSDNIPGIEGVGAKTAVKLVNEVAALYEGSHVSRANIMTASGTFTEETWSELLVDHMIRACTNLVAKDSKSARRYRAVAVNVERVATNLALMDVSLEEFPREEFFALDAMLSGPCQFTMMKAHEHIQRLQFGSALKSLTAWVAPFERLSGVQHLEGSS